MEDDTEPKESRIRALLRRFGLQRFGRFGWWAMVHGAFAIWGPVVLYQTQKIAGFKYHPDRLALFCSIEIAAVVLCGLLFVYEFDERRRESQLILRRYVEGLRRYAVNSIEPIRETVDALRLVNTPKPPDEVPLAPRDDEQPLRTRERNTLLRIVYGMATAAPYRFDPTASRSEVAATIASATAAAGCPVHEDTIRKWLREAAEKR